MQWVNQGTTSLPRRNPLLKKNYSYIQTESGDASKPNGKDTGPFLIQYLGDSSESKVFAHQNTKADKATTICLLKASQAK